MEVSSGGGLTIDSREWSLMLHGRGVVEGCINYFISPLDRSARKSQAKMPRFFQESGFGDEISITYYPDITTVVRLVKDC